MTPLDFINEALEESKVLSHSNYVESINAIWEQLENHPNPRKTYHAMSAFILGYAVEKSQGDLSPAQRSTLPGYVER